MTKVRMCPRDGVPGQVSLDPGGLELVDRDELTGLWNRRRFEDELDRRVARPQRDGERLALLWIDVDRYRELIQQHGVSAAERLIRSISDALAKRLGPHETLARMGGDEFAAVVNSATPHLVRSLADDLCTAVREQPDTAGASRVHATISIGGVFSTRACRRAMTRCSPPTAPCTRPRSQAATARSFTSPGKAGRPRSGGNWGSPRRVESEHGG